jgi:hypothetical protein
LPAFGDNSLLLSLAKIPIFCKRWTSGFAPATVGSMIPASLIFISSFVSIFKLRRNLAQENLALRQQLAVYQRRHPQPQLLLRDRLFWVWLSKIWGHFLSPRHRISRHRRGYALRKPRVAPEEIAH